MKKSYILIPARLDSGRLVKKMVRKFSDDTCVIERTVKQAVSTGIITYLITDAQEIIDASRHKEDHCYIQRSGSSGTDRISKFLSDGNHNIEKDDCCIVVLGDQPEVSPSLILDAQRYYHEHSREFDGVTFHAEVDSRYNYIAPYNCKMILGKDNQVFYISRSPIPGYKDMESLYNAECSHRQHISIVALSCKWLTSYSNLSSYASDREGNEWLSLILNGCKIKSFKCDLPHGRDVNTVDDWEYYAKTYTL